MDNGKKLKIDFFVDKRTKEICGWRRMINEIYQINKCKIDAKFISYDSGFKFPFSRYYHYLFNYPKIIKKRSRPNAIKVLSHQELAYLLKFFNFRKSVVFCLDIIPHIFPFSPINKLFFNFCMKSMKKATRVIVISKNTQDDLVKHFNFDRRKTKIIYLGVSKNYKTIKNFRKKFLEKYQISSRNKIILYVGSEAPNKNTERILIAIKKLEKEFDVLFIKIGRAGSASARKKTLEKVRELDIKNIKIIDYIEEKELPLFYNAADLFIYPSLYEGFGLPPLEAMACGCPVVTSKISSLPEVVDDACLTVNPYDVNALTKAIKTILINEKIKNGLIKRGFRQAKKFTWERAAKETFDLFMQIANG